MIAVHDLIDAATVGDSRPAVFLRDQCFPVWLTQISIHKDVIWKLKR